MALPVLLVSTEGSYISILEQILIDLNFQVRRIRGDSGLLKQGPLQEAVFVLWDIDFYSSGELDSLEELYRTYPQLPVVVMTGLEDEAFQGKLLKVGNVVGVIAKPFGKVEFYRAVIQVLQRLLEGKRCDQGPGTKGTWDKAYFR